MIDRSVKILNEKISVKRGHLKSERLKINIQGVQKTADFEWAIIFI